MRRVSFVLIYCLIFLAFTACSKSEQAANNAPATASSSPATATKTPPADIVRASSSVVEIKAGGAAEATVQVTIANGYHINGNPASKYQIATTLEVEPRDGLTAGPPQYPPSINKKFSFSPEMIAVYENEATIKVPLRAAQDAATGARSLRAKLRVQPCDDQACYPPRNIETSLQLNVK